MPEGHRASVHSIEPLARGEIEADQLQKLRTLIAAVRRDNRFYGSRLLGVDANLASLEAFSHQTPFTTKQELMEDQRRHPPYGSNLTYPMDRYTRFWQTSGTSHSPMHWLDTPESWQWMLDNWARVFEAAGVTARDTIFFAFSFGPFLGFWTAYEQAARMGCLCVPGGGMRSAGRLRTIIDAGASVLCCTPTYAIRLAEVAAEEDINLADAKVRTIIVAGEPGGSVAGTSRHISELWNGAHVVDQHGMTEIGPASYGCPRQPGILHVIESAFIVEVIDPESGQPVPRGSAGELVLTNLGRTGSPLLRYRTGDLVQTTTEEICACGTSDIGFQGGILGRTDDMLVVRGVNVFPSAMDDVLRSQGGVAEYRVHVQNSHAMAQLRIEVEPVADHAADPHFGHRLEMALVQAFALRIPVAVVPGGHLPRFEMKANRWVRS
jgi:phenylacetate-CoA ligase